MNVSHARHREHAAPLRGQPPHYPASVGALLLAGLLAAAPAAAQEQGSVSVAIDGATVKLSIVTYKPRSDGPFPTLIIMVQATSNVPTIPMQSPDGSWREAGR
jgi:hypothetical protein